MENDSPNRPWVTPDVSMPDSYGRPLCSSPRLRCEMSHAMPIVTNTNEMPAKANPTTYQMPVNRTPFERRAGVRVATEDSLRRAQPQATGRASLRPQFY